MGNVARILTFQNVGQCATPLAHLGEWLQEHRQRGVGPGGGLRLAKLLQDEVLHFIVMLSMYILLLCYLYICYVNDV
jgi:hypothetical protein